MSVSSLSVTPAVPRHRSVKKGVFSLVLLAFLLLVSLVAQVYLAGVTIETKHRTEVAQAEATNLEGKSADLASQLAQRLSSQAVEKYATEKLGMKFAHADDSSASIVYLTGQDLSSFAQAAPPSTYDGQP